MSTATTPSPVRQLTPLSELRVLSVKQPWAWQIFHDGKDIENRLLPIGNYRGPVAIFAPAHPDVAALRQLPSSIRRERRFEVGAVIGAANLVDSHDASWCGADEYGNALRMCSPWALRGQQHLVLTDPIALREPVEARGRRGLWRVGPGLLGRILEQLG